MVVEGSTEVVTDAEEFQGVVAATNAKYDVDYSVDFCDPTVNATYRVGPRVVFGLVEADFAGSPTRGSSPIADPAAGRVS